MGRQKKDTSEQNIFDAMDAYERGEDVQIDLNPPAYHRKSKSPIHNANRVDDYDPLYTRRRPSLVDYALGDDRMFITEYGTELAEDTDEALKEAREALKQALSVSIDIGDSKEHLAKIESAMDKVTAAQQRVRQTYINSLKGDTDTILSHIRAVIASEVDAGGYKIFLEEHKHYAKTLEVQATRAATDPRLSQLLFQPYQDTFISELKAAAKEAKMLGTRGFNSYRAYLASFVPLQMYALEYYGLSTAPANELLDSIAAERYARPKSRTAISAGSKHRTHIIEPPTGYIYTPSGKIPMVLHEVASAHGDVGLMALKERRERINHRTSVDITPALNASRSGINPYGRTITLRTEDKKHNAESRIALTIDAIDQIHGASDSLSSVVTLLMSEAANQCIIGGEMVRRVAHIPLQKMVDLGMYSSKKSARTAFTRGADWLTSVKIYAEIHSPRQQERLANGVAAAVLFTGWKIYNSVGEITLNPDVNWQLVMDYYMQLPQYYYRISNKRHQRLLFHIHYMLRVNASSVAQNGYLEMDLRTVQEIMELPSEAGCPNPSRDIKDKIYDAITAIEDAHKEDFDGDPIELILTVGPGVPIADWLKGKLRITPNEALYSSLEDVSAVRRKRITAQQKKGTKKP